MTVPFPIRRYHQKRFAIHWICVLVFIALPFFDIMRFDLPRQRFYFFGQELWINEFAIIFFTLMFLLFTIVAASMIYGRVYCSYLCPQMIFSEASLSGEAKLKRWVNKHFIQWPARTRAIAAGTLFYTALAAASTFLAFVFICYFVEPRDLIQRLLALDVYTAGGIAGAATTLLTFADFAFLRTRFCTTVCPYGYLQGMFADKQTLLVVYRDGAGKEKSCIECKKCVRVCHMGIDIRKSPYQIECIHCGECVEACDEVLTRLGKPGLIHYTWGEQGQLLSQSANFFHRIGLRDAKRFVLLAVMFFYASGLTVALSMRHSVQVRISPDRAKLYTTGSADEIVNTFRVEVANRSRRDSTVTIRAEGLAGASLNPSTDALAVKPGETITLQLTVSARDLPTDVNHFRFVAKSSPQGDEDIFATTFIAPAKKKS